MELMDGLDGLIAEAEAKRDEAQAKRDEAQKEVDALLGAKLELGGKPPAEPRQRKPRSDRGKPRKRKGNRSDQAVALVEAEPGLSASEVAKKMGIKPNYLYRILGDLEKDGRVSKDGSRYYPKPQAVAA
jgi:predicted Rossmann fold nucleotide-binding protein DprA/Smf involved in DNA uptake